MQEMHIVESIVKRGDKVYRYVRLVQSYRRKKDGMPAQKVLLNLGDLPAHEVENLKLALAASREGERVVSTDAPEKLVAGSVQANLRYLDIAVACQIWREWGLSRLLLELSGGAESDVPLDQVVMALATQRCVAPGSKLSAERWFPTTALPELLRVEASSFNNSRIHRVLAKLAELDKPLQKRLSALYLKREGAHRALFLDVTDTWFVGRGPELAQRGKTKEGLVRKRIGIVLLCNQDGYPLRWGVVSGLCTDGDAMAELLGELRRVSWIGKVPLVCDRAMGKAGHLVDLATSGLRFVTALPVNEIEAYSNEIPHAPFASVELTGELEADIQAVAALAANAGMQPLPGGLWAADLGLVSRGAGPQPAEAPPSPRQALLLAMRLQDAVDTGRARSVSGAGKEEGMADSTARNMMRLLKLPADVRQRITAGEAESLTASALRKISTLEQPDEQRTAFESALALAEARARRARTTPPTPEKRLSAFDVRAVAYFNPQMFVEQRGLAERKRAALYAYVADLNLRLASPGSRRNEVNIRAEIDQRLRRHDLVSLFEIEVYRESLGERSYLQARLRLQHTPWQRRRRYDGFFVLVTHPELDLTPDAVAALYRSKDAAEKDFQTIKSVVELRPVRHRTDDKVRAHVSLCMLALLLERTLEKRLAERGLPLTAPAAFEQLETCHLNLLTIADKTVYTITRPTDEQRQILRALGLETLVDDREVNEAITPR